MRCVGQARPFSGMFTPVQLTAEQPGTPAHHMLFSPCCITHAMMQDFERAGLTWLCLKAGPEVLAERETAAAVLQTLQDTTAAQLGLPTDHAHAVLKFFAQQGAFTQQRLSAGAAFARNYNKAALSTCAATS